MSDIATFRLNEDQPRFLIDSEKLQQLENDERARRAAQAAEKQRETEEQAKAAQAKDVDHVAELTAAPTALEDAVIEYKDNKEGKPNMPLINARQQVAELQATLEEALKELRAEEAKGSWIDQLDREIMLTERAYQNLAERYAGRVRDQVTKQLFGRADYESLSDGSKEMVCDHERVRVLRKFTLFPRKQMPVRQDKETGRHVADPWPLEYLYERAEQVAQKLVALRSHIAAEEQSADQTPYSLN
jgi:hypothetical protein